MKYIFLAFVLVIVVSGCIAKGTRESGVVVKEFRTDFNEIYSNEEAELMVLIKNAGSVDAKNVNLNLIGIDDWDCNYKEFTADILLAQTLETDGEERQYIWKCKAPDLSSNERVTYHPEVKIDYEYSSDLIKSLTILRKDELKRIQDSGKSLPTETISRTNSPIFMELQFMTPIRYSDETSELRIPLTIKINNAGKGVPCTDTCSGEDINKVKIKLEGMDTEGCDIENSVKLWNSKERTITCTGVITNMGKTTMNKKMIRVHADYKYIIEQFTNIDVIGK